MRWLDAQHRSDPRIVDQVSVQWHAVRRARHANESTGHRARSPSQSDAVIQAVIAGYALRGSKAYFEVLSWGTGSLALAFLKVTIQSEDFTQEYTMIDLHYWPTPNGYKVGLMLEECQLDYTIYPVNIGQGDQFREEFLAIAPNNRIPAIIDHAPADQETPISVFESGAILLYLAEKTGQFYPHDLRGRYRVMQWLMWQMGGLGPMAGQNHHFNQYAPEPIPYAKSRYTNETARLYGVLDRQLEGRDFIDDEYSIADMACYPWIAKYDWQQQNLDDFPNVKAWYARIAERPATVRAYQAGEGLRPNRPPTDAERENLFGKAQAPR